MSNNDNKHPDYSTPINGLPDDPASRFINWLAQENDEASKLKRRKALSLKSPNPSPKIPDPREFASSPNPTKKGRVE